MNRAIATLSACAFSLLLGANIVHAQGAADNTNSEIAPQGSYQDWLSEQSQTNHGYISRREYMDEMGRRWDRLDREHRGLTPDQIDSMYEAPSPGEVKAPGPHSNPTGTEREGQNSGGK